MPNFRSLACPSEHDRHGNTAVTSVTPMQAVLSATFLALCPLVQAQSVSQEPAYGLSGRIGLNVAASRRLVSVPVSFFFHSLAGVLFGVHGPLQFVRALRQRFGTLHRLAGRIFVLAGTGLAMSGLSLLLQVDIRQTIATVGSATPSLQGRARPNE